MRKIWSIAVLVGLVLALAGPAAVFADDPEPQATGSGVVSALPTFVTLGDGATVPGFNVCWTSSVDSGLTIQGVRIWYSRNLGPWTPWPPAGQPAAGCRLFGWSPTLAVWSPAISSTFVDGDTLNFVAEATVNGTYADLDLKTGNVVVDTEAATTVDLLPPTFPWGYYFPLSGGGMGFPIPWYFYARTGGLSARCLTMEYLDFVNDWGGGQPPPGGAGEGTNWMGRYEGQFAPGALTDYDKIGGSTGSKIVSGWLVYPDVAGGNDEWVALTATDLLGNWIMPLWNVSSTTGGWFWDTDLAPMACPVHSDTVGHWAEDYIAQLRQWGVVAGYDATTFGPNDLVTRAQFAKMVTVAANMAMPTVPTWWSWGSPVVYSDVPFTHPMAYWIDSANLAGLIQGYGDGRFGPDDPITRAQAAAILDRATGFFVGFGNMTGFSDTAGHWAEANILNAQSNAFIDGYPDGTFLPDNNITRGEAAKMIYRLAGWRY